MFSFSVRNLKLFFKEKGAVFFSLLGVLIIVGLYVVFLGDAWANSFDVADKKILLHNWIIAGVVSVASITTAMGAFGVMVEDRARKRTKDFFSSPIQRSSIVGGYIFSAFIVGMVMSVITFVLGQIYIVTNGGEFLPLVATLKVLGIIGITCLASASMVFFIVSFFSSISAFNSASTILGTLIGFLTGMYLPIGTLPDTVQWIIKLFPVSHAGALLRQVMMENAIATSFNGVPETYIQEFKEMTGIVYKYGSYEAQAWVHILVLLGTAVLFFLLAWWNVNRKSKQA